MTQHLSAFYESIDNGGAYGKIAAVEDTILFTNGDDLRPTQEVAQMVGAGFLTASSTLTAARITSPTLRKTANPNFEPVVNAAVFGSIPEISYFPANPMNLRGNESINCEINSDNAGAIAHYGLVWLADGPVGPVNGDIISVRGDCAAALAAGNWVEASINFETDLEDADWQVVGLSARGTNLVAARMIFKGGVYRPGVPAINAIGDVGFNPLRFGRSGVMGEFNTNQPPTIEFLGVTDTAQDIVLDLIKVG